MDTPRWLELAQQFDKDNLSHIDERFMIPYTNGISVIYVDMPFVYKRSIPFLIENEIYLLEQLRETRYVPLATKFDKYTLQIEFIKDEPITNATIFEYHCNEFLGILEKLGITHGDLTEANIIVRDNKPMVIDWAESRLRGDPRPGKRMEGDGYWMQKSMEKMLNE